jgi:hypothetical protein
MLHQNRSIKRLERNIENLYSAATCLNQNGSSMKVLLLGCLALLATHVSQAQTQVSVSTDYLTFSGMESRLEGVFGDIKNEYKIEDSTWVTLNGSHSFSNDLYGFLDISTRQEDASNNLKLLASLTNKDWSFRTRRGQMVGEFSQFVDDGSANHQTEEVNTEYFSIDAQYGVFGIRYVDMAAPSILEYPPTIDISGKKTITKDGLDPEFSVSAYEVFIGYDGFHADLAKSTINTDWHPTALIFLGLGFGSGKVSEIGKANYEKASGETIATTSLDMTVIEMESKVSLTKDFLVGSDMKASIALGYTLNLIAFYGQDGSSFAALEVEQEIFQHGPSLTFGMNY